jgi:hypothetical protein
MFNSGLIDMLSWPSTPASAAFAARGEALAQQAVELIGEPFRPIQIGHG